ncbi:DUF4142 domain-containing protein [Taibaiella helva]|uniref:DUF4142 domain-containing protein n=1 Tax=Taibaiella helva TaxID=2301235 RepID=UPI000E58C97B|nr:DUF4142 domain-containing protein [Taibaiella helva]
MKKHILFFPVAVALLLGSCNNNGGQDSKEAADSINESRIESREDGAADTSARVAVAEDDAEFAVKAAAGGLAEVELGALAQQKGVSAEVKDFGGMMVKDHSAANDELKALAHKKGITLPATPDTDEQKLKADLSAKSGADFDKAYIKAMIDDHEKDVRLFEKASRELKDPELQQFATTKLPVLRSHLEHCQAIGKKVK